MAGSFSALGLLVGWRHVLQLMGLNSVEVQFGWRLASVLIPLAQWIVPARTPRLQASGLAGGMCSESGKKWHNFLDLFQDVLSSHAKSSRRNGNTSLDIQFTFRIPMMKVILEG
jgi:hypothetical protein